LRSRPSWLSLFLLDAMAKKPSSKTIPSRPKVGPRKATALAAPRAKKGIVITGDARFAEVIALIEAARGRAYQAVNAELVALYWQLGEYINRKIASAEWGDGVVEDLATSLARRFPGQRGFTRRNLFRMRQFFEAYPDRKMVSAVLTQLPWTHHLIILAQAKLPEARDFYVQAAIRERWSSRELERQMRTGGVLRAVPKSKTVSALLAQTHPTAIDEFKSAYNVEFLGLAPSTRRSIATAHSSATSVAFSRSSVATSASSAPSSPCRSATRTSRSTSSSSTAGSSASWPSS
jgi:predicted nuclease of restriction endonuclease-like (RecB) superfamily